MENIGRLFSKEHARERESRIADSVRRGQKGLKKKTRQEKRVRGRRLNRR